MAALTANTPRRHRSAGNQTQKSFVVANGQEIFFGAFVGVYSTGADEGYVGPWSVVTGNSMQFLGMATKYALGDTTLAEPTRVTVNCGGIELIGVAVTGASAITNVMNDKVYLANDNDFTISAPAAGGVVGKITKVYSSSLFDVRILSQEAYAAESGT